MTSNHKTLILLLYYDRPLMVRNALRSILKADKYYENWEVAFIDDSSPRPGRIVAEEVLQSKLGRVQFYHTETSIEEKRQRGGSVVGKYMNQAIADSDADLVIMLCDDDELCPKYLFGLNEFFAKRPEAFCCYCHVHEYNPAFEQSDFVDHLDTPYNKHTGPINPYLNLDASQVAWRSSMNRQMNIWFPWPQTKCLDASFYKQIGLLFEHVEESGSFGTYSKPKRQVSEALQAIERHGMSGIPFSGLVGQYKGVHTARLMHHAQETAWERSYDIPEARRTTPQEAVYSLIWSYGQRGLYDEARRICKLALEVYPDDELLLNSIKFNGGA